MELVDQCLDLPQAERESLLARADPTVSAEARRLLEADARSGAVLDEPAGALMPSALRAIGGGLSPKQRAREGTLVGPFRLVSLVGEGGMGEVWIAERAGADFRQKVAVKLLHVRADAASLAARFRLERRILARLEHPRIARLLDGGTTQDGTPWLAMEYVEGLSLTEHCAARGLSVEERLRLFAKVCDAVQFAHRNLVVHRDLKPGNVLVTADGEPKLLDFGIAKLLEDDAPEDGPGILTRTGERPMTPDYAAPEQVRGEAATTATDVWALGVILHELLSGVRPYRGSHKSVGEVERAILEAVPSRPSTHAGDRSLRRRLRGDLDAIVLKALRARPEDRYPSVEALASDVRRHLEGLPVAARGETATYLLRSFVRRYRLVVSASGLGLGVVLAGLVGTVWQAHRARQEARKAEQVQEFLLDLLQSFDPGEHAGRPVSERDILLRGEERLPQKLAESPEVQAKLLRTFGRVWFNMYDYEHARPDAQRAIALDRAALGPGSDEEAFSLMLLGDTDGYQHMNLDEAIRSYQAACAIYRKTRGPDAPETVEACTGYCGILGLQGKFPEAERMASDNVARSRRLRGERDSDTLAAIANRGLVLGEWGRLDEAVDIYRYISTEEAELSGPKHPETLQSLSNLGRFLVDTGRFEEAEAILHPLEDDMVALGYGQLGNVRRSRARALDALGRRAEALALLDESVAFWTRSMGARSERVAWSTEERAIVLHHLGRLDEAEAAARQALEVHEAHLGDNYATARARSVLGSVLLDEGRVDEAKADLSRALAVQERILWPGHPYTVITRAELARADALEAAGR